jgi:ASC-1-like (ASCH) protein
LRKAYQLTEPCLVTKCYQCQNDEKFNLHDVCIFVTGDELRITTNLLHGFFNPENDLGCYILSRDEISLSKIPYNGTLATSLCCPDTTFILGQRAYGFIIKQFLKSQGENSMSFRDVHLMKLQPSPFDAIKNGYKTLELRLNDGKRQKIAPGDDIIFTQTETGEQIRVHVTALRRYPDFEAMYAAEHPLAMGYKEGRTADPKDMSQYYTEDEIKRYGTVAIEIKRIDI